MEVSTSAGDEKVQEDKKPQEDGEVLFFGSPNWDEIGKKNLNAAAIESTGLWTPHRIAPLMGVPIRLVASGPAASHAVLIGANGDVFTFGRNTFGQLGLGHQQSTSQPTQVKLGEPAVHASAGRHHTLVVTASGAVFSFGANKSGQLGHGHVRDPILSPAKAKAAAGVKYVKVACGAEFSMLLDSAGALHSSGLPEYGQLGHGTDGKYFITASKLAFNFVTEPTRIAKFAKDGVKVVDVTCGNNHTVALTDKNAVYSWGFGGYGRLGHGEPKDEFLPKQLADFECGGVIAAGSACTFVTNQYNQLCMTGRTKSTGEANMYPKLESGLSGWKVRSISSGNSSTIVAADASLITWGPSPTYGELGYGLVPKSSTVTKKVDSVEGRHFIQVAAGFAQSYAIMRASEEADKATLAKLPVWTPPKDEKSPAAAEKPKPAAKPKAKAAKKEKEEEPEEEEEEEEGEEESDEEPAKKKRKAPAKKAAPKAKAPAKGKAKK
eukprot:TRINITY_DN32419_c0_g1_i1.p1 TRINITY_DN32419_c0_g1~~TRINITY_DN32419_c0_g1_i1.p1  ORF type:complete len:493 (+),score=226.16 TRINITY_DN32419_c0_g1_i1:131-1609(+)